jgi:anti-sigma factor RsiW
LIKMIQMIHRNIDIYDIQAFVDNELGSEDRERVSSYIAADSSARKYYESLLNQKKVIRHWWGQKHTTQ